MFHTTSRSGRRRGVAAEPWETRMETTCLDDDVAEAAPLFENRDWRLHVDGLEHRETGYFIDRDTLNARRPDGHWEWPLHLSEKSWCGVRSFREAFTAAL